MVTCDEMRKGQIYSCEDCGIALQVIEECKVCTDHAETGEGSPCTFVCCDKPLKLKK